MWPVPPGPPADQPQRTAGTIDETVARVEATGRQGAGRPHQPGRRRRGGGHGGHHRRPLRPPGHPDQQRRHHLRRRPRHPPAPVRPGHAGQHAGADDRPPPGRPGHARRRRRLGGQRLVGGRPLPPSVPHGLRHVQGGPRAHDRRRRLPAGRRPASPSTASASTWPWPPRGSWPTPPAPTTRAGSPRRWPPRASSGWCASRCPTRAAGSRMFALRHREGIMASRVAHPVTEAPPVELANGLVAATETRLRRAVSRRPRPGGLTIGPDVRRRSDPSPRRPSIHRTKRSMSTWPSAPQKRKRPSPPARPDWCTRSAWASGWTPRTSRARGSR